MPYGHYLLLWLTTKTPEDYKSYKALIKSSAKAAVVQAKMAYYDELYNELETIHRLAAKRYVAMQDIGQVKDILAEDGRLLRDLTEIMNRWCEFFRGISNTSNFHTQRSPAPNRPKGP